MTNQTAFEKWWLDNREHSMLPTYVKTEALETWQAAQEDQAEHVKELDVDIKRLKRALEMGGELYRHDIAQLKLNNAKLRKSLNSIASDTDTWHSNIALEALSDTQPKPQPKPPKYFYAYQSGWNVVFSKVRNESPNHFYIGKIEVLDD